MSEDDEGGDAVCWLDALCTECGAMPGAGTDRCWRCGAQLTGRTRDRVSEEPERRSTRRPPDEECEAT